MTQNLTCNQLYDGIEVRWEWKRDGDLFNSLPAYVEPLGRVRELLDGSLELQLLKSDGIALPLKEFASEGYDFWYLSGGADLGGENLDTLSNRLRGIYNVPVNDGAGLLNGKAVFTRTFETSTIMKDAADRIDLLEGLLLEAAMQATRLVGELRETKKLDEEREEDEQGAIQAYFAALFRSHSA